MSILLTRKNPLQPLEFTKSVMVDSHLHKDPGCVKWGISWNARGRNIPRRLWRSGKGHNPESCRCTSYYPPEVSSHEVTFATKVGTVFLLVACTKAAAKSLFLRAGTFHSHVSMFLKRTILFKASHAEGNRLQIKEEINWQTGIINKQNTRGKLK